MKLQTLLNQKNLGHFYIMHLSYDGRERKRLWDYACNKKIIGLSHGAVNVNWTKAPPSMKKTVSNSWKSQFNYFIEMEKGDIVVVMNGWSSILGIAEILKDKHCFDYNLFGVFFDHYRDVEWIQSYEYVNRKELKNPIIFRNSLAFIDEDSKRWNTLIMEDF